jgi:hypothetical protein
MKKHNYENILPDYHKGNWGSLAKKKKDRQSISLVVA